MTGRKPEPLPEVLPNSKKTLIYGFGNPGRQDDGLGPAFAGKVESWKIRNNLTCIDTDSNYQLNIEDALLISEYELVIFADATTEEHVKDFHWAKLEPSDAEVKYTLHAASPGYILRLCHELYHKFPETYLLKIRGYRWEMKEELTDTAKTNLSLAFDYFVQFWKSLQ